VRLPSLISRFERDTKSGDPFGVPEMVQSAGSESIRDDDLASLTGGYGRGNDPSIPRLLLERWRLV
jgi:hypothetical protein